MGKLSFTPEETKSDLEGYERHWREHGFGLWGVEEKETGALVGRVGLAYHRLWPHDPEVGWLVDTAWQGRGFATEAGAACISYAFEELEFERLISICTDENVASRRVMKKLGLEPWREIDDPVFGLQLMVHARER
jgi:RimJ/RimL family protein N-acetyltransferase